MHEIQSSRLPQVDFQQVKCITGIDTIRSKYPDLLTDESRLTAGPIEQLYFPGDESELAAVLSHLNWLKIPVTISGGRTGLVGGSVAPGGDLISLSEFSRILAVQYDQPSDEWRVTAQAGVSLRQLNDFLSSGSRSRNGGPLAKDVAGAEEFFADPDSWFYPPDPTETSASLGGTVATNASGARTYRFGPTRAWVRGLRVLLANGECLDVPRGKYFASTTRQFTIWDATGDEKLLSLPDYPTPKTKNAAGMYAAPQMDLIDLFIGSEGILGVVTRVEVALLKQHEKMAIIQFLESSDQAVALAAALRGDSRLSLDYLEFYSGDALQLLSRPEHKSNYPSSLPAIPGKAGSALFYEFDRVPDTEDAVLATLEQVTSDFGADLADSWVGTDPADLENFRRLRHLLPETVNAIIADRQRKFPELHKLSTDLAVPDEHLPAIWSAYQTGCRNGGFEWVAFGHIGDNHIHVNILPRDMDELQAGKALFEQFARLAVSMGGTVSAEHGIGRLKKNLLALMYSPEQIAQMRQVKQTLDPNWILNPGVLFEK